MIENEEKIIEDCSKFLKKSSTRYSSEITRQKSDLQCFAGNFWDDNTKKAYKRAGKNKLCLHFSDWSVLASAISSPFSNSPWHVDLYEKGEDSVQDTIDELENENDTKYLLNKGFHRGVVAGAGYIVVSTDEIDGEVKPIIEFIQRQDSVALDPYIETADCSDAEEGAIINYISTDKAKRLYGDDVLPFDYPHSLPKLSFVDTMWCDRDNQIQIVSYYKKNDKGFVDYYKICGNKVIENFELPIKYIPIVRFAGYDSLNNNQIEYTGIVNKTYNLQLGLNIAYSTLMERANRSIKANVLASTKAVENLDPYYEKKEDEDGSMILFNEGATVPQVLTEQFATGDLSDIIQNTRNLIADVIGIPLAGILNNPNQTATEILIQQTNRESNVAQFYENAYRAVRTIARIILQMLTGGSIPKFELVNGPDVITANMKHRQELQAVASLVPPEMQPLVAVHMCDTIESSFVDNIKNDLIANLPDNLKLTKETEDPIAIHQITVLQNQFNQAMEQAEALKQENDELKQQYQSLQLAYQNQQVNNQLKLLEHKDNMYIKEAELQLKAAETGTNIQVQKDKADTELAKETIELEKKKLELAKEML
jgi:hypothetical protein